MEDRPSAIGASAVRKGASRRDHMICTAVAPDPIFTVNCGSGSSARTYGSLH